MALRVSFGCVALAGALIACSSSSSAPNHTSTGVTSESGGSGAASGGNSAAGTNIGGSGPGTGGSGSGNGGASAGGMSSGGTSSAAGGTGAGSGGMSTGGLSTGGTSAGGTGNSSGGMAEVGGIPNSCDGQTPKQGQCICRPQTSERKAPDFTLPAPPNAPLVLRFMNNCPMDLWVHGNGVPGSPLHLAGRVQGQPPTEEVYDWGGLHGRMTIYENNDSYAISFMEMNADPGGAFNVNLSAVDWVGIPIEVKGDNPAKCLTACYTPLSHMMDGCPPQLLDAAHHICQAPKNFCANQANANDPICTKAAEMAQGVIDNDPQCSNMPMASASNIYGCGGPGWSASPRCCAEATRGYKTDIPDPGNDNTQNCKYYQEQPYSDYSAYEQHICPYVYSFAYDDWNDQSGFQGCQGAKEMDVTFCPGDP